jgi:multidrug efflux system outer membrane protein
MPNRPPRSALHRPLAVLLCSSLVAGCAQQPALERPAPPVPTAWSATSNVDAQDATRIHWRNFFADARLQALIAAALEHNRDLRVAAARVQEARAQYGISRADRLPTINLNAQAAVQRSSPELSGVDAQTNVNRYDLAASMVSFELDFWGRLARLSESARASYLATAEAQRALELSLIADVASAYFTLLQQDEALALAQSSVASREESLDLLTHGVRIGVVDDYAVQQATGALESARGTLFATTHQRALAQHRLHYLVGQVPSSLPSGQSLATQSMAQALDAGVPGDVLLLRPDVAAAEQRLLAAHANVGAARAAFFPKIALTAALGFASPALATLLSGGAWNFQPAVSLPLFDGGRTAAQADVAEARKVVAIAEYEKTIQLAFREVADQLSAQRTLEHQLQAASANQRAQQRRVEIAQARFAGGMVGYLEVLEAQRDLVAVQQNTIELRRAQLDASTQLYKALGGGMRAGT